MKIILLGAPGAGKGTQAQVLSEKYNIPTISTGNILRAAIKEGTVVGLQAKKLMEEGHLVPDDIIIEIIRERLACDDCANGYILDGVPRTIPQAEIMEEIGIEIDTALSIEVSDEVIVERMSGRRTCHDCGASFHIHSKPSKVEGICDLCGCELEMRSDDAPETIKKRLEIFHSTTEPLKDHYGQLGKLVMVENQPTVENTTIKILEALNYGYDNN